jgi:hypothetical protein
VPPKPPALIRVLPDNYRITDYAGLGLSKAVVDQLIASVMQKILNDPTYISESHGGVSYDPQEMYPRDYEPYAYRNGVAPSGDQLVAEANYIVERAINGAAPPGVSFTDRIARILRELQQPQDPPGYWTDNPDYKPPTPPESSNANLDSGPGGGEGPNAGGPVADNSGPNAGGNAFDQNAVTVDSPQTAARNAVTVDSPQNAVTVDSPQTAFRNAVTLDSPQPPPPPLPSGGPYEPAANSGFTPEQIANLQPPPGPGTYRPPSASSSQPPPEPPSGAANVGSATAIGGYTTLATCMAAQNKTIDCLKAAAISGGIGAACAGLETYLGGTPVGAAGQVCGAVAGYLACVQAARAGDDPNKCTEESRKGLAPAVFCASVGLIPGIGPAAAAACGTVAPSAYEAFNALKGEEAAEEKERNNMAGAAVGVGKLANDCNYTQAETLLRLDVQARQEAGQSIPSWVGSLALRLEKLISAQQAVDAAVQKADAMSDLAARQRALKAALDTATLAGIPVRCLPGRVASLAPPPKTTVATNAAPACVPQPVTCHFSIANGTINDYSVAAQSKGGQCQYSMPPGSIGQYTNCVCPDHLCIASNGSIAATVWNYPQQYAYYMGSMVPVTNPTDCTGGSQPAVGGFFGRPSTCTGSSGSSASAAPAGGIVVSADTSSTPPAPAQSEMAALGPPQEQAATSMAGLGPPPDSPATPIPAGPSSSGNSSTAMVTPPAAVPAPPAFPAMQPPTASYKSGSNVCNPTPPAPPKPGNVCTPSTPSTAGNTAQQTAAVPPQNPQSPPTARVNSGECHTVNGQTICTDASGNSCTTTAGFCDPAVPQTTKTAAAPTPPAPNAAPLQLKPPTQMASAAQPCSPKSQTASVPACSSKPPYLPWGGTGSATITVSGGQPCGVGWHDTPGGPGGVTVLDSMTVSSPPSHGSLKPRDQHVIIFSPASGYKGQDSFTLSMQEHNGGRRATLSVKVSVTIQ